MNEPPPSDGRGRILVVEDNPSDLQYLLKVLQERGYTVHPASDARLALRFVETTVPDLVLLDSMLPGMGGYAICQALKANPRVRDVPVIFVSGADQVLDKVKAFSAGAVDYILKPFHPEEALARIDTHLALRRLRRNLEAAKERAEQASLAKSQFLAGMSHELRTPLNAILGYAQILGSDASLTSRQQRGIKTIHESGEHLLTLINDILDLARIEAGKLELAAEPTSLSAMLRFVVRVIEVKAEQKGLMFGCELASDLPEVVVVDEKRLRQILLNLLSNAVKFTSRGTVVLRAQRLPHDGAAGEALLRFSVEDTGCGIDAQLLQTVFEPFEQAGDRSQRAAGTGLGLSISRRLLQRMGSDVQVTSELGKGSRFWFDIRLRVGPTEEAVAGRSYQRISGYEGPRRTVVVADDVQANRAVAVAMLGMVGFKTVEARDGKEALQKMSEDAANAVIMDVMMPVLDGLEAIRIARSTPELRATRVIAVSASSYESDMQHAMAAGADAFLPKPLDFDKLLATIGPLLQLAWICEG